MTIELTLSSVLLLGAAWAAISEACSGNNTPLEDKRLIRYGFEENNWADHGRPYYKGYVKWTKFNDSVLIEKRPEGYYLDGTDFEIKTVGQLKKLYEGLTGEKL